MKRPDPLPQDDPEEWMDHAEAVRLAESVVNWVKGRLVTSNKEIEHV